MSRVDAANARRWSPVSSKGSGRSHCVDQLACPRQLARTCSLPPGALAPGQRELEQEELLERQAVAGLVRVLRRSGKCVAASAAGRSARRSAARRPAGQRLDHVEDPS